MTAWPTTISGELCCYVQRNIANQPFPKGHKYAGEIAEYFTKTGSDGEPCYALYPESWGVPGLEEPLEGMVCCSSVGEPDKRYTVSKAMLKELHSQFDDSGQPKSLSAKPGEGINEVEGNAEPDGPTHPAARAAFDEVGSIAYKNKSVKQWVNTLAVDKTHSSDITDWYERSKALEDKGLAGFD